MPELTIDATEAKSFEPIPDGIYDVRVREISEPKDGPNSTYVNVTFEIEDGDYEGRKLWRVFPITGKGVVFFTDLIAKALGEHIEMGEETAFDSDDLIDQPVRVVVAQETYEDNTKAAVKKVLAPAS